MSINALYGRIRRLGPIILEDYIENCMMVYQGKIAKAPHDVQDAYTHAEKTGGDMKRVKSFIRIYQSTNRDIWMDLSKHLDSLSPEQFGKLEIEICKFE